MAKSLAGVTLRAGTVNTIGDSEYKLNGLYDPAVDKKLLEQYKTAHTIVLSNGKSLKF